MSKYGMVEICCESAPFYSDANINLNSYCLLDMNKIANSGNTISNEMDNFKQDCCLGKTIQSDCCITDNIHSTNQYYNTSLNCCTSSDLEDMENQLQDSLYTNISRKPISVPPVRVIKKRNTANKKERRRTQSINNAFSCLRDRIPNVPPDTKLSKIKTLKLAILYIKYLLEVLDGEQDPRSVFHADLRPLHRKNSIEKRQYMKNSIKSLNRSGRGRTGWPQDVWASELITTDQE